MTNNLFTYVSDEYIEDFLNYKSAYSDVVAFLGTSGQIVARENIYGFNFNDLARVIDDDSTYTQAASAKAVNDKVKSVETSISYSLSELYGITDDLNDAISNFTTYYNITTSETSTFEKINGNVVKAVIIPVDSSQNLATGGTLSNFSIRPWLDSTDKHLEIQTGGTLSASANIVECTLVGQCTNVSLSMIKENGVAKMWSMLPLDIALTTASQVIVKYY